MKKLRCICASCALLFSFIGVSVNAEFYGVLPATPGGSDWQAYYDDQLDVTWLARAWVVPGNTWDNQVAWAASLNINGVTGWRLPSVDVNGDGDVVSCHAVADQSACKDNEFGHLFHYGDNSSPGVGVTPETPEPFTDILGEAAWWSSTEGLQGTAWLVNFFGSAFNFLVDKNTANVHAWAVASGNVGGAMVPDADADGVSDSTDNCTNSANPGQQDADSDGHGNRCDADFDNNCVVNVLDLGYFKSQFFTSDALADLDSNGVVNVVDLGLLKSMFFGAPGPSADGLCP